MPRIVVLSLLAAVGLSLGCSRNAPEIPAQGPPQLLSHVDAADPRTAAQMLEGFHPIEQRLWCWTTRKFAVALAAPPAVDGLPVEAALRFTLPEVIIEKVGPVTLTARIDGVEIGSQRYDQPSINLIFVAEIPDAQLASERTVVEFELDKSMIADEDPRRELGIVFLSAALQ